MTLTQSRADVGFDDADLPFTFAEVVVVEVERLSPSFRRVEFAGPGLVHWPVDAPQQDQRIKLVFPNADGGLPRVPAVPNWYELWRALPEDERGHIRTYSVRRVHRCDGEVRLVVDFVLHEDAHSGPGSRWAAGARRGDRLIVCGPRAGVEWGGIEFVPGTASRLLIAGDETAVPAVMSILETLPADARGRVFLEVPTSLDVQLASGPVGVQVTWLPRDGAALGRRLIGAVRDCLGLDGAGELLPQTCVGDDVWETPCYSAAGESTSELAVCGRGHDDLYAWIAGECRAVTTLRRALITELGLARVQVAFMGYWREGRAMA